MHNQIFLKKPRKTVILGNFRYLYTSRITVILGFFRKIWLCIIIKQLFIANICNFKNISVEREKDVEDGDKEWDGGRE